MADVRISGVRRFIFAVLGFGYRIGAASGPDHMIVVRREWTARLEPPARDWTARIATLRFQDRMLDGVGSSVWVVPVPSKDEAEFGVSDTHEPHWLYLSQLAQAAFSLNNTCVDAALLVSHIWPSQAHRMQAWVQAQPVAAHANLSPKDQGCRRPAKDGGTASMRSMRFSMFPILSVMPPAQQIVDLEGAVSSVECQPDVESPLCIYRHVCFVDGVVELASPTANAALSASISGDVWNLPDFTEARLLEAFGPEPTRLVGGRTVRSCLSYAFKSASDQLCMFLCSSFGMEL